MTSWSRRFFEAAGFKIKIAGMSSMIRLAGSKSDGNGADSPKAKDGVSNDLGEDEIPF